jgi:hypothetical protein
VSVIEPVGTGFAASLARPAGNITGFSNLFSWGRRRGCRVASLLAKSNAGAGAHQVWVLWPHERITLTLRTNAADGQLVPNRKNGGERYWI